MHGYWNNPDATAATITDDGWLKTGDAGYIDRDGYVYLHDRKKDMIVSGGENVYPIEVENVLITHPAVDDVAVIGVPDGTWGEAVKAVVVAAAGTAPTEAELIAYARERLGGFKLPEVDRFRRGAAAESQRQTTQTRPSRAVSGQVSSGESANRVKNRPNRRGGMLRWAMPLEGIASLADIVRVHGARTV